MIIQLRISAALLVLLMLISACGQKGPLFLPGDPSQIQTDVPAQSGSSAEENEDTSDEDEDDDSSR
jgi:predicted small lipoprotein YifL